MANKVSRSLLAQRTLAAWPKNWPIRERRDQHIAKKTRGLLLLWFSSSFFAAKIWRWPFSGIQSIIRISNIYWVSIQFNEPLSWHKGTARKFDALGSKQVKPGVEVGLGKTGQDSTVVTATLPLLSTRPSSNSKCSGLARSSRIPGFPTRKFTYSPSFWKGNVASQRSLSSNSSSTQGPQQIQKDQRNKRDSFPTRESTVLVS